MKTVIAAQTQTAAAKPTATASVTASPTPPLVEPTVVGQPIVDGSEWILRADQVYWWSSQNEYKLRRQSTAQSYLYSERLAPNDTGSSRHHYERLWADSAGFYAVHVGFRYRDELNKIIESRRLKFLHASGTSFVELANIGASQGDAPTAGLIGDDDHLYWVNSDNELMRVEKSGGTPIVHSVGVSGVHLSQDSDYLYLSGSDGVRRIEKDCTPLPCTTSRAVFTEPSTASVSAGDMLYVATGVHALSAQFLLPPKSGRIVQLASSGGSATTVHSVASTSDMFVGAPSHDGRFLYWTEYRLGCDDLDVCEVIASRIWKRNESGNAIIYDVTGRISDTQSDRSGGVYFQEEVHLHYLSALTPPISRDMSITGIEVTQGIQSLVNDVELVQGDDTFVRVYATERGFDRAAAPDTSLTLTHPDRGQITLRPESASILQLPRGLLMRRSYLDGWLYRIPNEWTKGKSNPFTMVIEARLDPRALYYDENSRNNVRSVELKFHRIFPQCLNVFPILTTMVIDPNKPGKHRNIPLLSYMRNPRSAEWRSFRESLGWLMRTHPDAYRYIYHDEYVQDCPLWPLPICAAYAEGWRILGGLHSHKMWDGWVGGGTCRAVTAVGLVHHSTSGHAVDGTFLDAPNALGGVTGMGVATYYGAMRSNGSVLEGTVSSLVGGVMWYILHPPGDPVDSFGDPPRASLLAHELGHTNGRCHVNVDGGDLCDAFLGRAENERWPYLRSDYPYLATAIGRTRFDSRNPDEWHYGLDPLTLQPVMSKGERFDPQANHKARAYEVMSYSDPVWTSPFMWRRSMSYIDSLFDPGRPRIASVGTHPGRSRSERLGMEQSANAELIMVTGVVTTTDGTHVAGELMPAWRVREDALGASLAAKWRALIGTDLVNQPNPRGAGEGAVQAHVRLIDADGKTIGDREAGLDYVDLADMVGHARPTGRGNEVIYLMTAVLPVSTTHQVARLELLVDDHVVDKVEPGSDLPTITLISPGAGMVAGADFDARWRAADPDGDPLLFTVQYSRDGGKEWMTLVAGRPLTPTLGVFSLPIHSASLPGTTAPGSKIRVAVSDGLNSAVAESGVFHVPARQLDAAIELPAADRPAESGTTLRLRGAAHNPNTGEILRDGLTWKVVVDAHEVEATGHDVAIGGLPSGRTAQVQLDARLDNGDGTLMGSDRLDRVELPPLVIPGAAQPPLLDGACDDAQYASGPELGLRPGDDGMAPPGGAARAVYSAGHLWVCFQALRRVGTSLSRAETWIARGNEAASHVALGEDGVIFGAMPDGSVPEGLVGHRVYVSNLAWTGELRIPFPLPQSGGAEPVWLAIGHLLEPDRLTWPLWSVRDRPRTWSQVTFGALPDEPNVRERITLRGVVALEAGSVAREGTLVCTCPGDAVAGCSDEASACGTTDAEGRFETLGFRPGAIRIQHLGHLSAVGEVPGSAPNVIQVPEQRLVGGDVDQDDEIWDRDLGTIAAAWNQAEGDERYRAAADVNSDGKVGAADLAIVVRNWRQQGPKPIVGLPRQLTAQDARSEPKVVDQVTRVDTGVVRQVVSPTVQVLPGRTVYLLGEEGVAEIRVANASQLMAFTLEMRFDPSRLHVEDSDPLEPGIQIRLGDVLARANLVGVNRVDNDLGVIEISVAQTFPESVRNGDGVLAAVEFRVQSLLGDTQLAIRQARLFDGSFPTANLIHPITGDAKISIRADVATLTPTRTPITKPTPTRSPTPPAGSLANISTRAWVGTGDRVMIGGFIVQGAPMKVIVRGRSQSLAAAGVPGLLPDPRLRLFSGQAVIAENDNWQAGNCGAAAIAGLRPTDPREACLVATLTPGPYTAIVDDAAGRTGIALVEVFHGGGAGTLSNISTRGMVRLGDDVMIGGFIVRDHPRNVVVRARAGSLAAAGVPDLLPNPRLRLFSGQTVIAENDDWQAGNCGADAPAGLRPTEPHEACLAITLPPGSYTGIVDDMGGHLGIALVEVFKVGD